MEKANVKCRSIGKMCRQRFDIDGHCCPIDTRNFPTTKKDSFQPIIKNYMYISTPSFPNLKFSENPVWLVRANLKTAFPYQSSRKIFLPTPYLTRTLKKGFSIKLLQGKVNFYLLTKSQANILQKIKSRDQNLEDCFKEKLSELGTKLQSWVLRNLIDMNYQHLFYEKSKF